MSSNNCEGVNWDYLRIGHKFTTNKMPKSLMNLLTDLARNAKNVDSTVTRKVKRRDKN